MNSKRLDKFYEGACEFYRKSRESREIPIPKITIRELDELLNGYCDMCEWHDGDKCRKSDYCMIPRIRFDLDKLRESRMSEMMEQAKSTVEQSAVPTDLAFRFTEGEEE